VPVARVREILTNARTKEAARVTEDLTNTYGIDAATYQQLNLGAVLKGFLEDPVKTWRDLGEGLRARGIPLDGFASGAPAGAAPPPAPPTLPAPDMQASDGTPAYSATRMIDVLEFKMRELEQKWSGRVAPLESTAQAAQQERINRDAHTWASQQLETAKSWPGWDAPLQQKVFDLMKRDARFTLEGAYVRVFKDIYPGLEAQTRQKTINELKSARSATTAAPTTPAGDPVPRSRLKGDARWDSAVVNAIDQVINA
jgi:hypothetical protein